MDQPLVGSRPAIPGNALVFQGVFADTEWTTLLGRHGPGSGFFGGKRDISIIRGIGAGFPLSRE